MKTLCLVLGNNDYDGSSKLKNATVAQLKNYTFICLGTGIEWEELDYHLSIESMLQLESSVA